LVVWSGLPPPSRPDLRRVRYPTFALPSLCPTGKPQTRCLPLRLATLWALRLKTGSMVRVSPIAAANYTEPVAKEHRGPGSVTGPGPSLNKALRTDLSGMWDSCVGQHPACQGEWQADDVGVVAADPLHERCGPPLYGVSSCLTYALSVAGVGLDFGGAE
jgi:hypothetical protein